MPKYHLSLFLLCLSIAVSSAGVLPRASSDIQNDILNLEPASEKDVSEVGLPEDGNGVKQNIGSKSTNSSFVSEIAKIGEILNPFSQVDDVDDTSPDGNGESGGSQVSPIKVLNDSVLQVNVSKSIQDVDLNTTNLKFENLTSAKISNETDEINWPLNEVLNETTDESEDQRSPISNSDFLLKEEIEIDHGDNKTVITEILNASFSVLPNETFEFDEIDPKKLSSIQELEILLNETDVFDIGNFNSSDFVDEIELSINITGDGEDLYSNSSSFVKAWNSSDLMNETEFLNAANLTENFGFYDEHNESSVVSLNETGSDLSDKWSLAEQNSTFAIFSNDTRSSLENITDIDVGTITSMDFSNVTDMEDTGEGIIANSNDLESHPSNLNETISGNMEMNPASNNLGAESDGEITPMEGSFPLTNVKEESEGLFSNFGFDFLTNSQIAKNAAKAMEIFNLSDSITDHIIEEHEFHSFLDATPVSVESGDAVLLGKLPKEQIDPSIFNISGSPEGLKTLEAEASDEKTSLPDGISEIEGVTLLNDTMLSDSANSTFNLTNPDAVNSDEANLPSNSSDSKDGSDDTLAHNGNSSTNSITGVKVNGTDASPKCPPPGVCIFWFLAQDTCAMNSHCLGSRICCRIRCSKTCIEV